MTFTASNGITISELVGGIRYQGRGTEGILPFAGDSLVATALDEWFQHRRDARLGRWRDPVNPLVVVYPGRADIIKVVDEYDGTSFVCRRGEIPDRDGSDTARRYFAAHPEPKPWRDAPVGELWRITCQGLPLRAIRVPDGFTDSADRFHPIDTIEDATRLYPQGDQDE